MAREGFVVKAATRLSESSFGGPLHVDRQILGLFKEQHAHLLPLHQIPQLFLFQPLTQGSVFQPSELFHLFGLTVTSVAHNLPQPGMLSSFVKGLGFGPAHYRRGTTKHYPGLR